MNDWYMKSPTGDMGQLLPGDAGTLLITAETTLNSSSTLIDLRNSTSIAGSNFTVTITGVVNGTYPLNGTLPTNGTTSANNSTLPGLPTLPPNGTAPANNTTPTQSLNSTTPSIPTATTTLTPNTNGLLQLSLINNLPSNNVQAYVTGLDTSNQLVMLQPSGQWHYPTANTSNAAPERIVGDVAITLGGSNSTTLINLPGYISAARIWFAEGDLQFYTLSTEFGIALVEPSAVNPSDPSADLNWGFAEFTYIEDAGVYADISFVDFVGTPLGMSLTDADGNTQDVGGLRADAVQTVCNGLVAQAALDGYPWDDLCVYHPSGHPLRVLAPTDYLSINNSAFDGYWTSYIDDVWARYTADTLWIDTQASNGKVGCTVDSGSNELTCTGDSRGYAQPTAADIFGCNSGPFAIWATDNDIHRAVVPRLCAAFNRATLLMEGGDVQPSLSSDNYYTTSPTNHFSALVHKNEIDGKGYAFAYDDVEILGGSNQAGLVYASEPKVLTITVGGI